MTAHPVGTARHADQVSYEQPPRGRLARLFQAADRRHVPLRTILVTVAVVVATYLAGVPGRADGSCRHDRLLTQLTGFFDHFCNKSSVMMITMSTAGPAG